MKIYCCITSFLFVITPSLQENSTLSAHGLFQCIATSPVSVHCEGLESSDEFQQKLQELGLSRISSLILKSSTMSSIPADILSKYNIRFLLVNNVTLDSIFDWSLNSTNSLVHAVIRNVHLNGNWSWSQLGPLNSLRSLLVYHTSVGSHLTEEFGVHASRGIKKLILIGAGVTTLEQSVFAELGSLVYLSLSRNKIASLKKNSFPRTLRHLRLHHNRIYSLEEEVFEELPSLKTIDLSHNDIASLPEAVFGPLWRNYTSIKLYDNPLKCDCSLKWTITSSRRPFHLQGRCAHPKRNYHKEVRRLSMNELRCSP